MAVPTLSLAKFHGTTSERKEFARELLQGLSSPGFVKLVDHGIQKADLHQLYSWNKEYFNLPYETKLATANAEGPKPQRGWSVPGVEKTGTLNGSGRINLTKVEHEDLEDVKEHYDIGPVGDLEFPNLWPEESALPGFRSWMEKHFDTCQQLTLQLMEALEVATDLPAGELTDRCAGHASELRLNHYPATPVDKMREGKASRIWPHTDFGVITLLTQDRVGGLEIEQKDRPNTFMPVPLEEETELVVNIGDCLERWTNGLLKAGLHRVTVPRDAEAETLPERFSIAFFLKAARHVSVGPIRAFVPEDRRPAYEDMTALEYHQTRVNIVY